MAFVDLAFLVCATVCILSALLMVTQRNPVYSVVYMLPLFLGMTTLFWLLSATFLAAMQMMVYGGAILVVFLFVIMLINLRPEEMKDDFSWLSYGFSAAAVGVLGGVLLKYVLEGFKATPPVAQVLEPGMKAQLTLAAAFHTDLPVQNGVVFGSIESIAAPLFKQYVVPFEIASILIVVAVLGSVLLSKKRV